MADALSPAKSSRRAMLAFLVAAVLVSAIVSYPWTRRSEPLIAMGDRKALHEMTLEQLDGGIWRLSEHRGQVVLINYWASWCGPCRTETPGLMRLVGSTKGLAVVGVSMDTGDRGPVRSFVKQMGMEYPIVFPEPMSQIASGMAGLPTTVLVDREGRVAKTYVGATREREFRADVEKLLRE